MRAGGSKARGAGGDLPGDDPQAINAALLEAIRPGATPPDLGRVLAYAAALRIARFGTANEFSDWDTALHVLTYANAVHRLLERVSVIARRQAEPYPLGVRAVFHGAMALYFTRFLNQPPARLPGERGEALDERRRRRRDLPLLLDAFDRQQQVNPSARLVARHVALGHPSERLIATLGHALLREDADFHTYQMFEAGSGGNIVGRAPGSPHPDRDRPLSCRALADRARPLQTATIARRLHRGERLYEASEAAETEAGA